MTRQIPIALLFALIFLSGCGEVTVFGHVVREGQPKSDVTQASSSSASSTATPRSTVSSTSQRVAPTSLKAPAIPQVETVQPSTPVAATKAVTSGQAVSNDGAVHAAPPLKRITLSMSPEMMAKVAKDARFNSKALLEAIKAELQSRRLLDNSDTQDGRTLAIYIDNYDLHATTNFSIFGAQPHTGTLAGNLTLSDDEGESTPVAHIEAYSRISVPEAGEDQNLLQPLYHEFAVTVANSVVGMHMKTSAERDQSPR